MFINANALHIPIASECVQCVFTSPPYYGLRSYLPDGHKDKAREIGLEQTPAEYVENIVNVFREVWRVLRADGTLWLNLGDSYASDTKVSGGGWANDPKNYTHKAQAYGARKFMHDVKPKDLVGIPWRVAFALQADGWYLRSDIIWHKPNPMPESVTDRPTKSHEYLFLLAKSERYFYDADAVKEPSVDPDGSAQRYKYEFSGRPGLTMPDGKKQGIACEGMREFSPTRNRRTVWTIATSQYSGAHFATFPPALVEPCILAGSKPGDLVLDPFMGSGTVAQVAIQHRRRAVGTDLNLEYIELARKRTSGVGVKMF